MSPTQTPKHKKNEIRSLKEKEKKKKKFFI